MSVPKHLLLGGCLPPFNIIWCIILSLVESVFLLHVVSSIISFRRYTLAIWFMLFDFIAIKDVYVNCLSNLSTLSVPDEGFSRNAN